MASGVFDLGVSKKRPGTSINFKDTRNYGPVGPDVVGGAGINGDGWDLPDYLIGKILDGAAVETPTTEHQMFGYDQIAEDRYCGAGGTVIGVLNGSGTAVETVFNLYNSDYPLAAEDFACGTILQESEV